MKRKYRSESEMSALVSEWQSSGATKKSFCIQHGISQAVFQYWQKKLGGSALPEHAPTGFVPVEVRTTARRCDPVRLTVKFADGVEVHVH